jgi:fatty acyl-CoA reductase
MNYLNVKQFYAQKTILLTGCTGFLGKVILEKLLRTTEFEKLYILIRPSKGASAVERLNEIFISPIFEPLLKLCPEIVAKIKERVVAIAGDLMAPKLGISPEQRAILV